MEGDHGSKVNGFGRDGINRLSVQKLKFSKKNNVFFQNIKTAIKFYGKY